MSAEQTTRRQFMKTTALATAVATTAGSTKAAAADGIDRRNERPDLMKYRVLGRTNFNCSTLTFGCGAALMGGRATRLLERAYEQGVNHFDIGTSQYYKGSEKELSGFLKKHGDDVWVTSKGFAMKAAGNGDDVSYTTEMAKGDAKYWTTLLDASLKDLGQEHVDAYYLMGIGNPTAVKSEELYSEFLKAKDAGKVDHFGISTHKRASACLKAAIECGWHSLAMIAITPGGWYDWDSKELLEGTASMDVVRKELDAARKAGIGLVGMKAGRFLSPPGITMGKGDDKAFDSFYTKEFLNAPLTPFQRSYAYVLENGVDTVNADMQNYRHFEENLIAARDSGKYFA